MVFCQLVEFQGCLGAIGYCVSIFCLYELEGGGGGAALVLSKCIYEYICYSLMFLTLMPGLGEYQPR